jgi:signal transduction histidine kinase
MKGFLKRHVLWAGFLAVLIPLSVMLVLQYRWLVDLESKTAIAHQATLDNYLESVTKEIRYFYVHEAERGLNVPSYMFVENKLQKIGYFFNKAEIRGAERLFVLSFVTSDSGKLLFYDPLFSSMEPPADVNEARAAYVAAARWQVVASEETPVESVSLTTYEGDPEHRIILNPILDDSWRVVGVAGMIVDRTFFEDELLPVVIEQSMPSFFSFDAQEGLFIHAHDGRGLPVGPPCKEEPHGKEVTKSLSFMFTDYTLGLRSQGMNPYELAQSNFVLNMSLSTLVAIILLSGVVMALRVVSREMKLSQMKGDFVSNVSHELRTPLASIRVFSEFLRMGRVKDPDKIREYGEYIETESRRLTGLVNNLLDFSKIESGGKTYNFEPADLGALVQDTLKTFRVRLRNSGFEIELDCPEEVPISVVDSDAVSQALSNLLDNAVKYSNGAKAIAVKVAHKKDWIVISVRDHGIGITSEEQEKIFERFHRVGTGLVHDVKGSGLGLSIVEHVVQAHKGKVTVESAPGKGSVFSIYLPVEAELNV